MTILTDLKTQILLFDGAMGTQLQDRGLPIGGIPEHFNLTHPEVVEAIHRDYVAAGADVITANTFQANTTKMAADELDETIHTAIALAKRLSPSMWLMIWGRLGNFCNRWGLCRLMPPMRCLQAKPLSQSKLVLIWLLLRR